MNKLVAFFWKALLAMMATAFLVYAVVYFAVSKGWTNEAGIVDINNSEYAKAESEVKASGNTEYSEVGAEYLKSEKSSPYQKNLCKIEAISKVSSTNAEIIKKTYDQTKSLAVMTKMILAVTLREKDNQSYQDDIKTCENDSALNTQEGVIGSTQNVFSWVNDEEWQIIDGAIDKDKEAINKAANEAGIEPRMLVCALVVEQLRLYHTQREVYERFFKPFKVLGSANKMAWGVMSIKEKTAIGIENNLKDKNSSYYLGDRYEKLLDFKSDNPTKERYDRLVDENNHYYSYLYASLYLKELDYQWKRSGYMIGGRPEILITLYNIGFEKSKPKADPEVGGSELEIKGNKYTFGSLGYEFYYSGELLDDFPINSL